MSGKLIIVSAPSGAGKTTIVKHLLQKKEYKLEFSISAASRKKREQEIDGKDYYFLSVDEFKKKISESAFIEWEEVYKDHFYGTLKSEIQRITAKGSNVLFDVDVKGGVSIKRLFPENSLSIFVKPPSIEALEQRLINRHTNDATDIKKRVDKAKEELTYINKFDKVLLNDKLDEALVNAESMLNEFLIG
ncbi:MAG TPA: guanylate kinase [Bacteroidales bacterium]|nr:MAG: guanylate kinase [Bacteroidetes bacterium GWF2_33_38]OFY75021.1 MAG: guanylate kinase [Bacteroidetes bacterium RIFOXYA12_FULL_33_9]OFY88071.1 MAG: guanylate kinase [Bacteroidetes bacterium RIFOXYA2_FULL_33_7]HBF87190.1 guanylate kinase [Bacteroidales bacterium]